MKTEFIVRVFLTVDRGFDPGEQWVFDRIKQFRKTTLVSLLNQVSAPPFKIWLICGEKYRYITEDVEFNDCIKVYDHGKDQLAATQAEAISITRIDSDDLMHKDAMAEVFEYAKRANDFKTFIWKTCYRWYQEENAIVSWRTFSPPYFTHVFQKTFYKNFPFFKRTHFQQHGRVGKMPGVTEMSEHKICTVRNEMNASVMQGFRNNNVEEMLKSPNNVLVSEDAGEIASILSDFGISEGVSPIEN